jgi:D-arabinose 1-dehydrogenase-like Zn-dependent alcohol dehydrogenase
MSAAMALVCRPSDAPALPALHWMRVDQIALGDDEVRVKVLVASVNPIDVKRAAGYGRRVLSLLGARGRERVLGNDFAGVVTEVGAGVQNLSPGDRVWGLVPTGPQGSHRSEVCVSSRWVRPLPASVLMVSAAVLPYTFTTLWRALMAVGLNEQNAAGRHVLVNGAGGALGQLAIQLLCRWGAVVTAVCGRASHGRCLALGATRVVDRHGTRLLDLPSDCDVTLNFGDWSDEADVIGRLHPSAMGHATTVHPLLGEIDARGWLAGGLACWRAWRAMRQHLRVTAPNARYAWTVFKPDDGAMNALQAGLQVRPVLLEVAHRAPFTQARSAYSHVGQGRPTRAVLMAEMGPTQKDKT